MPNKMLIDASHPEETRVVVVRGNRIEEFDFESQDKKQLRGNIYLARVTRVEPSLQAAFVEYGGNRHGFLAFSEIHPDYYQIPVADRQALLRAEAEAARAEDEDDDEDGQERRRRRKRGKNRASASSQQDEATQPAEQPSVEEFGEAGEEAAAAPTDNVSSESNAADETTGAENGDGGNDDDENGANGGGRSMAAAIDADVVSEPIEADRSAEENGNGNGNDSRGSSRKGAAGNGNGDHEVESVGAEDALEEVRSRRVPLRRQYKIQEVIKRRQILLVQVVKEERGNKGAALTTYLSLAGRYSVLMPNTARGGGISRKITNPQDRKRLKEIVQDLNVPEGMGVILRTAGQNRTKAEVKRDYEYLLRLWENVRSLTLQSIAPALVYEEGSLIKRAVRDLYNKDIDEIQVAGEDGYREAKDFMRMLMPSHAKVVQPYRDKVPLFARFGVEAQLDRILLPQVTLKSGGYIIINQTEALVSIDVNSGRSTKEHSIEDTALQTNLEAAEEVARQLRLRDLAGLIVIDFIDMEESRNNRAVEKRLKDCLKNDRARIQVGRISHFGLLEMSRQRIRASVLESTTKPCPHCGGTGHVRSDSSVALLVIRAIEEFLLKDSRSHIVVRTPAATALYVLNHKRANLVELEKRFGVTVTIESDETVGAQHYQIARGALAEKPADWSEEAILPPVQPEPEEAEVVEPEEDEEDEAETQEPARSDNGDNQRKRRRRRRRRGRDRSREGVSGEQSHGDEEAPEGIFEAAEGDAQELDGTEAADQTEGDDGDAGERRKRRRGKRGGRRHRREEGDVAEAVSAEEPVEGGEEAAAASHIETSPEPAAAAAEEVLSEDLSTQSSVEEAVTEAPAEKPKRRTRRTKAAVAAETQDVTTPEPTEPAQAEAAPEKPKRASRRRAQPAKAAEEKRAEAAEEQPAGATQDTVSDVAATEDAAPAPQPAPAAPEERKPAESDKPRRVGWWQRKGFF